MSGGMCVCVCVCVGRGGGFHLSEFPWILMWRKKKIRSLHRFYSNHGGAMAV